MTQPLTADTPTATSRRTLVGLCVAMGGSLIVAASFNYLLSPMVEGLGLSDSETDLVLVVPAIGSLLIVFVAGLLGDRLGHRKVITWMGVVFVIGCALVMVTPGAFILAIGLLLASLAATAIQIVVFGLLSDSYPEPKQRAWAFGTFGMVSPFSWMIFPVITGALVIDIPWRIVPAIWVVVGGVMVIVSRLMRPKAHHVQPLGEVRTSILAGMTVVFLVQGLSHVVDDDWPDWAVSITFLLALASAIACGYFMRKSSSPSFSLAPLRVRRARLLLIVVVIIVVLNTVFLMTIAFQYLYGLSVLQTALIMVPAQIAAILGTRFFAGPLMRRIGVTKTAALCFAVLAVVMLGSLVLTPSSPLWVPALYVLLYNLFTVSASITVASGLLSTASEDNSGLVSAYRGSGQALGGALAAVLMNSLVFGLGRLWMLDSLEANGLSASDAQEQMDLIASATPTPGMTSEYTTILPDGVSVDTVLQNAMATGLHINGIAGAILSVVCVVLILRSARPSTREQVVAQSR